MRDFEEKWLQAGMAKREPNVHVHATCLNQNRSEAHQQERDHSRGHSRIYTDGSINPRKQNEKPATALLNMKSTPTDARNSAARDMGES